MILTLLDGWIPLIVFFLLFVLLWKFRARLPYKKSLIAALTIIFILSIPFGIFGGSRSIRIFRIFRIIKPIIYITIGIIVWKIRCKDGDTAQERYAMLGSVSDLETSTNV